MTLLSFFAARGRGCLPPLRRFHAPNDLISDDDGASHGSKFLVQVITLLDVSDMVQLPVSHNQ